MTGQQQNTTNPISWKEQLKRTVTALHEVQKNTLAKILGPLPGIINSFNPTTQTASIQPAVQTLVQTQSGGAWQYQNIPLLLDVPLVIMGGGKSFITFPITQGDECLYFVCARSIDAWWQLGNVQPQGQAGHLLDISDTIAIVGPRSQPKAISNFYTNGVQLRCGSTTININQSSGIVTIDAGSADINLNSSGKINLNGNTYVSGNLNVTGTTTSTGDVKTGSISLKNHTHSGVQSGGSDTGPPV